MKKFLSVLLSCLMVLSTVSFAAPNAVSTFDTASFGDFEILENQEMDHADLASVSASDYTWIDDEKGTKLFVMDFEKSVSSSAYDSLGARLDYSPNAGELVSDLGFVNPDLTSKLSNLRFSINYITNASTNIETSQDGSKHLSVTSLGTAADLSPYIRGFWNGAGIYTFELDYKHEGSVAPTGFAYFNLNKTLNSFAKTGEWVKTTLTVKLDSEEAYNRIRITAGSNYSSNDKFLFDNICYYYKPYTATVTIDGNDVIDDVVVDNVSTEGVLVSSLLKNISYSGTREFLGISKTKNGTVLGENETIVLGGNTTLYTVWGEDTYSTVWLDDEKGTKLFDIDFSKKNDGTDVAESDCTNIKNDRLDSNPHAGVVVSDIGCLNPTLTSSISGARINIKDGSSVSLTGSDNKSLVATTSSALSVIHKGFYVGEGIYTFSFDYKTDCGTTFYVHSPDSVKNGTLKTTAIDGTWTRLEYVVSVSEDTYIRFLAKSASSQGSFTFDNFKVYYKPKTVSVTLKGQGIVSDLVVDNVSTLGILVDYLIEDVEYYGQRELLGISKTADGEVLSHTKNLVLSKDETFYLVWSQNDVVNTWYDDIKGTKLFGVDFSKQIDSDSLLAIADTDHSGTAVSNIGSVNPYLADDITENYKLGIKYVTASQNKVEAQSLQVTPNGSAGDVSLFVYNYYRNPGIYTFDFDYKHEGSVSPTNVEYHSLGAKMPSFAGTGSWIKTTYTTTLSEKKDENRTRIIASSHFPTTDFFSFDNISVYYKPTTASVTLDPSGNSAFGGMVIENVPTTGILVSELLSRVSYSGSYEILGVSRTPGGNLIAKNESVVIGGNCTLYIVWNDTPSEWYDGEKGVKLINIDFSTNDDGNKVALSDCEGIANGRIDNTSSSKTDPYGAFVKNVGKINPSTDYPDLKWAKINFKDTTSLNVLSDSGNDYFSLKSSINDGTMSLILKGFYVGAGAYTIQFDYNTSSGIAFYDFPDSSKYVGGVITTTPIDDTWTRATYVFDATSDSFIRFRARGASTDGTFRFDNISVYYNEVNANVTVSANNNAKVKDTILKINRVSGMTVEKILSMIDTDESEKALVGISLTADGKNMLQNTDRIYPSAVSTLYLVWGAKITPKNHGTLLFNINYKKPLSQTSQALTSNVSTIGAYTNPSWTLSDSLGVVYGKEDIGGETTYIPAKSPLYVTDSYTGNRYYRQPADSDGISEWAVSSENLANFAPKDGIFTLTYKFKIEGDDGNIDISDVYVNATSVKDNQKVRDDIVLNTDGRPNSAGWTKVTYEFDMADYTKNDNESLGQIMLCVANTVSDSAKETYICYDDVKLYYKPSSVQLTLDPATNSEVAKTTVTVKTTGVKVSEIVANVDLFDTIGTPLGISKSADGSNMLSLTDTLTILEDATYYIVWDNADVDSKAPVSENINSIRTDEPQGIRYKAYMTTEAYANATQVGFVISRYDLLKKADVKLYSFTLESEVNKVYAYNKNTDGTDRVFLEDDTNTYLTAVLYNIPEKHYNTKLVARPFATVDGVTYYGKPIKKSICEVAEAIRDTDYSGLTSGQIAHIKNILTTCSKPTEKAQ